MKVKDILAGYKHADYRGHVLWTAMGNARPALMPGWWRIEVIEDTGLPGNKFYPDGEMEIGDGRG